MWFLWVLYISSESDKIVMRFNMVSTNPPIGAITLNRMRNTFCGVPKAEIERRTNALLQSMTVSLIIDYLWWKKLVKLYIMFTQKSQIWKLPAQVFNCYIPFFPFSCSSFFFLLYLYLFYLFVFCILILL